ncbi:MAG TPA: thioredoxin [Methanocorpusculum sp.]|nr:thioredoxin [Methanocorpusculum sp.]
METPVSSPEIRHLTEASFNKVILSAKKAVVDFWAEWCGPCRRFAPVFEQLSIEFPDVQFCKCNTDENQGIAQEFFIFSIPTTLFVRDGRVVHQISGAMTEEQFREVLTAVFADAPSVP